MRHRRTRDIVIELTSLLDVVMILIFAVMVENSQMIKAEQDKLEAANGQITEMENRLEDVKDILDKTVNKLDSTQAELDKTTEEKKELENEYQKEKEEYESVIAGLVKDKEALSEEVENLTVTVKEEKDKQEQLQGYLDKANAELAGSGINDLKGEVGALKLQDLLDNMGEDGYIHFGISLVLLDTGTTLINSKVDESENYYSFVRANSERDSEMEGAIEEIKAFLTDEAIRIIVGNEGVKIKFVYFKEEESFYDRQYVKKAMNEVAVEINKTFGYEAVSVDDFRSK